VRRMAELVAQSTVGANPGSGTGASAANA